jgi:L-malate glycosyltransferase
MLQPSFFLAESWNGIDEHLLLIAKHLDPRRYELSVMIHAHDGAQSRVLAERAGLRAVPAPYPPRSGALIRLVRLRDLYAAEGVDLLHLHSPVAGGQAVPTLAARLAGVPATVATYHQIQPRRLSTTSRVINYLTHRLLVHRIVAVSRDVGESLVGAAGLPRRGLAVLHNGIELTPPGGGESVPPPQAPLPPRAPGEVCIGYFGRLSPEKGLPCVLEALSLLATRYPQARTFIVGDGPERSALEAAAARLGLDDGICFLGFRPDARQLMEEVDIVVHAPIYEGFGLVVLEAMAASRAVVVNDAPGGLPEIVVPGETGLVVSAGCPGALAEALERLVADPGERARLGQNGRVRCEQYFSARRMAERTAELYDRALNGGGATAGAAAAPMALR